MKKNVDKNIFNNSEYPSDWDISTIDDIFYIFGGGTPSTCIVDFWNGNIPWISSADVLINGNINPHRYISENAVKNSATNIIPSNSIIVVTRVGLGKVALSTIPLCTSQDFQSLVPKKNYIDVRFAYYF